LTSNLFFLIFIFYYLKFFSFLFIYLFLFIYQECNLSIPAQHRLSCAYLHPNPLTRLTSDPWWPRLVSINTAWKQTERGAKKEKKDTRDQKSHNNFTAITCTINKTCKTTKTNRNTNFIKQREKHASSRKFPNQKTCKPFHNIVP